MHNFCSGLATQGHSLKRGVGHFKAGTAAAIVESLWDVMQLDRQGPRTAAGSIVAFWQMAKVQAVGKFNLFTGRRRQIAQAVHTIFVALTWFLSGLSPRGEARS